MGWSEVRWGEVRWGEMGWGEVGCGDVRWGIYGIVLYYEALYQRPIRPLSYMYRHSSGESEIRTQPWLSEGSLTCDPYHHRGST